MPHRRLRSASMTLAACALLAATGCAWRGGAKPSTPAARSAPSATLTPPEQALRDRVRELELRSPADYLEKALGQDIPGNWPGRL